MDKQRSEYNGNRQPGLRGYLELAIWVAKDKAMFVVRFASEGIIYVIVSIQRVSIL